MVFTLKDYYWNMQRFGRGLGQCANYFRDAELGMDAFEVNRIVGRADGILCWRDPWQPVN